MTTTISDLQAMRDMLVTRRLTEAEDLLSADDDEKIAKLANLQIAIAAFDTVIAERKTAPTLTSDDVFTL